MAAKKKSSCYIYDLNYKLFNYSGFGRLENATEWQATLYSIYHVIIHALYVFCIAVFIYDLYYVSTSDDTERLSLNLCVTFITAGSQIKIWALMKKMNNLSVIRKNFRDDFNLPFIREDETNQEIKERTADLVKKITKTYFIMAAPAETIWVLFPLLDPSSEERRFSVPWPIVTDMSSPTFELIYLFHSLLLYHFISNILLNDLLMIAFCLRLCEQYDILVKNLSRIKDVYPKVDYGRIIDGYKDEDQDNVGGKKHKDYDISEKLKTYPEWREREAKNLMRQNIIHHKRIMKQFDLVQETYGMQFFVNITVGAIIIAAIAFDVILKSRQFNAPVIQQIFYVSAVTLDVFIMSFMGTRIEEKSEEVVETLYDLPWYDMQKSNQKSLMFMIRKCRKPQKLRAKYVFAVNLEMFLSLMKTSYNFMAVLNESR